MSQSRQPELAFRNSHDASNKNGVVGKTGKNIPNEPNPMHINANMFNKNFLFFFILYMVLINFY